MAIYQDLSTGAYKVSVPNMPSNGNILTSATSVDIATNILITQTTVGITATLLNPTITTIHKVIVLENLPVSTSSIIISPSSGIAFDLGIGKSVQLVWNGTTWSKLIGDAKTKYGTSIPTVLTTDNRNDSYIITDTGINTGIVQSVWIFDGILWKKTVTITDPVIDFAVNADPNIALTTFVPNLQNMIDVLYRSTIDGSLWSSNGIIYAPSVATTNRTIQSISSTGVITTWNSTVQIGTIPLTSNITLTLPTNTGSKFKDIIFKRLDSTSFTVTIVAFAGETTEITTPTALSVQYGGLTVQSVGTLKSQQISNIGVGGSSTGTSVALLYANRILTPQTIATGTWANKDIIFNGSTGTIPYNTLTGVATLTAGITYNIKAGLSITAFGQYLVQYALVDAVTNIAISSTVEMVQATNSSFNISPYSLDFIYTPTVTQTVKIRIGASTGMQSGENIRYDLGTYFQIVQLGTVATLDNQVTPIADLPTGGALQATTISPYILGFNVTQTTAGQTMTIPLPLSTSVNRIIYVNNTGNVSFLIGSITVGISKTVAYIWNGVMWSNFSSEVIGAVLAEFGENNNILHNQNITSTTFVDITNSTFTLPTAGTWEVTYNIHSYGSGVGNRCRYQLVKSSDLSVVPNSSAVFVYPVVGHTEEVTQTVRITTTGSDIYKLQGLTDGSTLIIQNINGGQGGNSKVIWKKISGYVAITGSSVDYISANRTIVQTTGIVIGSPILFNNKFEGNLSQTNGIFTLNSGKTYQLIGDAGITTGDRGLSVRWRNLTTGLLIGNEGANVSPTSGNSNAVSIGTANAIITTLVITTVQLEIVNFIGGVAPTAIGYQVDQPNSAPYASIVQIGNTSTLDNQVINISDLSTGGAIQATVISPYILGFNITQTTNNQIVTIPNPLSIIVNRILYINNTGNVDFKIGTITVGVSRTVAYIWNGSAWSNFSTEVVGSVLSEYGENVGITNGYTINAIASDIGGSSFILPTAGVWEVEYNASFNNQTVSQTAQVWIADSLNIPVNNSYSYAFADTGGSYNSKNTSMVVRISTTGSATYKLRGITNSATGTIINSSGVINSGTSKISWKKISGYLPVTGGTVDYILATRSSNQASFGGTDDMIWNQTISGNILLNTSTGTFTLTAGKTYELESAIWGTGSGGMNISYVWADATTNVPLTNAIIAQATGVTSGNNEISQPVTKIIYTASVDQTVKVRVTNSNNNVVLNAGRSYAKIVQIGSTATLANTVTIVANLPIGGAIQTATIDAYVIGFNVNQTTAGQFLTIPNPNSITINRIIYVNNTGTVSFTIGIDIVQPNKTIGYIWNGTIWSVFGEQSVGAVISEYGENNTITNGQTTSSSTLSAITNATITLPSAGIWNIGYNMYAWQSSSGQTISFVIKDSLGAIVANSAGSGAGSSGNANATQLVSQNVNVTTSGSAIYTIYWATAGAGTATLVNTNPTTIAGSSVSKTFYRKVSGYLPVIGNLNDNVLTGLTASQSVPSVGSPFTLIAKTGSNLIVLSNQVVLNGGKSYKMLATIARLNGTAGSAELAYQFRDITNGIYLGNEGTVTQNTALGGGSTAMADIIVPYGLTITVQLWVTKNVNAGTIVLNGIGTGGAGSFYVYQDGSSAYNTLNTYVGASATTVGITGGVPASTIGDQGKMLMGDGTWLTPFVEINNIKSATASNLINNQNFAQTWNWSTATTQTPLSFVASSLTTGALLSLSTSATTVALTIPIGRVGINQTTPVTKFDVFGNSAFGIQTAVEGLNSIGANIVNMVTPTKLSTNVITTPETALRLFRSGTNSVKYNPSVDLQVGTHTLGLNALTNLNIRLGDGASHIPDVDVMTLQSDGKVGIGTTTPNATAKLEVVGNILATTFTKSGGLVSQDLLANGTVFDKYNSSISSAVYFQCTTTTATLIDSMTVTPPLAGNYRINFNTQFNTQLANITQQAVLDLNALYLNLNGQATTGVFPALTAGVTVVPGVYYTPSAVATTGTITLDGLGNSNSIFIFRTDAAFSTSASSVFNLVNGAVAKNIFFVAGGAITIGASSNISGTFISPSAPVNIGASAYINGRFYSIGSAITVNGSVLLSPVSTVFPMGVLANFILFTTSGAVTSSGTNTFVGDVGTNVGTVTGFGSSTLSGNIYLPNQGASLISVSIYIDNVIVAVTTRERTNTIDKIDVILSETVTLTAGQVIAIKVLNSIGISRFYNRNLTVTKV